MAEPRYVPPGDSPEEVLARQVARLQAQVDDLTGTVLARIPAAATGGRLVAKAYRATSAQSIPNATFTSILFNAEDYDPDGWHDNATNSNRLTCPAGTPTKKYTLIGSSYFVSNSTGYRMSFARKNGSGIANPTSNAVVGTDTIFQVVSPGIELAATDWVDVQVYQTSGGNLDAPQGLAYQFLALIEEA